MMWRRNMKTKQPSPLVVPARGVAWRHRARNMTPVQADVTPEQTEAVKLLCLGIFTDMTNSGAPLADVLLSIYLSGIKHAIEISERTDSEGELEQMTKTFSHMHVNNGIDSFCKECGLYLTHPVHLRI